MGFGLQTVSDSYSGVHVIRSTGQALILQEQMRDPGASRCVWSSSAKRCRSSSFVKYFSDDRKHRQKALTWIKIWQSNEDSTKLLHNNLP